MVDYEIKGLKESEDVQGFPEGITVRTRASDYDRLLEDAKKQVKKLTFNDAKRAQNVLLAINGKLNNKKNPKMKALKDVLYAGRVGMDVYVGPRKLLSKTAQP